MEELLPNITNLFLEKKDYFEVFAKADTRIEGWFKAELILLFSRLVKAGAIQSFNREFSVYPRSGGRRQIDFKLSIGNQHHFCELKALCISQAAGTPRNLEFYFRDDNVGIIKDLRKLDSLKNPNRWLLAFVYPSPSEAEWLRNLKSLPDEFSHWRSISLPTSYPTYVYISLLKG